MDLKIKKMKELINIRDIENIQKLDDEYDLQKALLLDRKLRIMVREDPSLKAIHDKLFKLIQNYESENWSNSKTIDNEQFVKSEIAESLIEVERLFVQQRKEVIIKRLKTYDMTQQDLGILLGHKKSYMSELVNGVSQFSLKDLVIIHRILRIDLVKLIPTYLQNDTKEKIKNSIIKLNKPKLKLRKKDMVIS